MKILGGRFRLVLKAEFCGKRLTDDTPVLSCFPLLSFLLCLLPHHLKSLSSAGRWVTKVSCSSGR